MVLSVTLVMVIGARCSTGVVSVAEHSGSVDPGAQLVFGPSTVALLVIDGSVKPAAMVPLTVITNVLGALWVSRGVVAVSVPPEMVAVDPVAPCVTLAVGFVRPAGKASVTLTLAASAGPRLVTVIV